MNTFNWQGGSGRWFEFEIARAQRDWESVGGVYMFVKPHDQPSQDWGGPICLFAAQTADFSATLNRHDMWQAAENLGAREIVNLIIAEIRRGRRQTDLLPHELREIEEHIAHRMDEAVHEDAAPRPFQEISRK